MHSPEYIQARKEFINCIVLSPLGFFIPLVLAFTEWLPAMKTAQLAESHTAKV